MLAAGERQFYSWCALDTDTLTPRVCDRYPAQQVALRDAILETKLLEQPDLPLRRPIIAQAARFPG